VTSVRVNRNPPHVFVARIVCSGQTCTQELELVVDDLEELEGISCDCGYGFLLLEVAEIELV
jgi:hypothetical protein